MNAEPQKIVAAGEVSAGLIETVLARGTGAMLSTAIAHPCDETSLLAAREAKDAKIIEPILVGPRKKIEAAAAAASIAIGDLAIEDVPHSHAAAARAVALVRSGRSRILMKGALHTDELMHEVMQAETGLRTGRRISHVYAMDVPAYPRPLLVTDAAINIAPDLETKRHIAQNAIDLAAVLGIVMPKIAVLAAVETVNQAMQSTIDAASLAKMAERGQITGGLVDGPLAFDNAVSLRSAAQKHISSPVAGIADIVLVPEIESGNMLAKQLIYLAGADAAGIVLGARVPIVLTSRADSARTRLASCAVAAILAAAEAVQ